MKPINVLSCFDGFSGGQLALQKAGIKVKNYFASEIDRHCIKVSTANFPDIIRLGDIKKVKVSDLPKIDLIIAGSPCQGFSIAGKRLNFADERSKLFFDFIRILNEAKSINPDVKFLLENVSMRRDWLGIISRLVGVYPIEIDSALVSAQQRKRCYWTNIRTRTDGFFDDIFTDIPLPKNKGLVIDDIKENSVSKKYNLSEKQLKHIFNSKYGNRGHIQINGKKAICQTARQYADWNGQFVTEPKRVMTIGKGGQGQRVYDTKNKGIALSANGGGWGVKTGLYAFHQQDLIQDANKKSRALVGGTHGSSKHHTKTFIDETIRRLTPLECKRLQCIPDNFDMSMISESQQYKMIGNGFTIDVIKHILSFVNL